MEGNELAAVCDKERNIFGGGGARNARLANPQYCDGDIANRDGRLRCSRPPGVAGGPAGSYTRSCDDVHTTGGVLWARCHRDNGNWRYTHFEVGAGCRGEIINRDGNLQCDSRGPAGGGGQYVGMSAIAPRPTLTSCDALGMSSYRVRGGHFTPNSTVFVRFALMSPGYEYGIFQQRATGQGTLDATIFVPRLTQYCQAGQGLFVSAHDGRRDSGDRAYGLLWTDTCPSQCR